MVVLKFILIGAFIIILYQDYKDRLVYWFLFPTVGAIGGILFYKNVIPELFLSAFIINICFVTSMVFIVFLYAKFKLKSNLLNAIGLGDLLLFFAMTASFSSISFITLFVSSLIFSLVLHVFVCSLTQSKLTKHSGEKNIKSLEANLEILNSRHACRQAGLSSVPLAGYMSLFFACTFLGFWSGIIGSLYNI